MLDSWPDSWRIPLRLANAAQLGGVAAAAFGLAWFGLAVSAGPDPEAGARRAAHGLARAYAAAIDQDLNRIEADARTLALLLGPARPGRAEIDAAALLRDWIRLKPGYRDAVLFSADGAVTAASDPRRRPASLRPQAALLRARNVQVAVMSGQDAGQDPGLAERPFDLLVTFGTPGQSDGLALGIGPAFFDEIAERVRRASEAAGEGAAFSVRGADGRLLAGAAIPEGEGASSLVRPAGPLASPGWTVTARVAADRLAPGALPPRPGPPAAALGLALVLAAAGLGYALAHRIARRLTQLAAAPAGLPDGAAGSRIRECDDLVRAVLDRTRSTACRLAGAETGLDRVQDRLHAFAAMSGWTCWEIDPAAQRVVWADRAPAGPGRGDLTADLAALRARIEPEDGALLDGAVAAAPADGLQDVVLRVRATPAEPAHRILVRVLGSPAPREGARRLHVLSRALPVPEEAPARPPAERRRNHVLRRVTDGIVHDVNDVLTVILASLGTLKRRHPLDGEQARYVETALAGALRGRALTRSMLAFVRNPDEPAAPEEGDASNEPPDCELPAVVASFVPFLQANVLHGTPVIDRVPARLPRLACSERILEMVLLNIALHFRDLGLQGFAIAAAEQQAEGGEGLGLAPGLYVRLLIASGRPVPGAVPPARAPTTLATAGALVARLRGGWRLRDDGSREGAFLAEIWLPALAGTADAAPALERAGLRVLLVEADSLVRGSVAAALAALGHDVAQAASAEHALRLLDERADYDAMIVDQAMPVMGGLQLAAAVVQRHPRIRIVLASPRGQRPAQARPFLHLEKPFRPEDLAAILGQADARVAA
ncbi:response regulator [Methylobacterium isbiliense]|uniref:histidine kinase n=1 Tax=Methylobacterium isbiliense TaxID=315478 RepID=A0ABQ4SH68_9HYPH|nr:response regulator [Methylobacterium isbiliense]GJE02565.1 Regulator of RpoS [Methylobacterium isbiliense]